MKVSYPGRVTTGIAGLDDILEGGLLQGGRLRGSHAAARRGSAQE